MVDTITLDTKKKRAEIVLSSHNEAKYLLDNVLNRAERVTPYRHELTAKTTKLDGSVVEAHHKILLPKEGVKNFANKVIKQNQTVFDRLAEL